MNRSHRLSLSGLLLLFTFGVAFPAPAWMTRLVGELASGNSPASSPASSPTVREWRPAPSPGPVPSVPGVRSVDAGRTDWNPRTTWVFVVGVLEWRDAGNLPPFPKKNRRDQQLVEFFRQAGVDADRLVYLQDRQATLKGIEESFQTLLRRIPDEDTLFVYFCGHGVKSEKGDDVFFCGYDYDLDKESGWSVRGLIGRLAAGQRSGSSLVFADCCHSGFLAEALTAHAPVGKIAVCSSSSASEVSTEHWTFTEAVLDALSGAPWADQNRDGRITLDEFAALAREDMGRFEAQRATIGQSPAFPRPFVLTVGARKGGAAIGERLEAWIDGQWWKGRVIEANPGRLKMRFVGWDPEHDEWVKPSQTRPIKVRRFPVGARVQVLWEKKWYSARVLREEGGVHEITYDGYGAEWNEWVAPSRIRPLKATGKR